MHKVLFLGFPVIMVKPQVKLFSFVSYCLYNYIQADGMILAETQQKTVMNLLSLVYRDNNRFLIMLLNILLMVVIISTYVTFYFKDIFLILESMEVRRTYMLLEL